MYISMYIIIELITTTLRHDYPIGKCGFYQDAQSHWLAIINENEMFSKPRGHTIKAGQHDSIISRCNVSAADVDLLRCYIIGVSYSSI